VRFVLILGQDRLTDPDRVPSIVFGAKHFRFSRLQPFTFSKLWYKSLIGAKRGHERRADALYGSQVMELYYKDLISKESSLEKLVDDLMLVVQGADELAQAAGAELGEVERREITSRLQHLKDGVQRLRHHAAEGAAAADKILRRYPYSTAGVAFAAGLLVATYFCRKR
jgi:ElaB/YqjD/DUF883 family membrane-anchored ribosome-binding protein